MHVTYMSVRCLSGSRVVTRSNFVPFGGAIFFAYEISRAKSGKKAACKLAYKVGCTAKN